MLNKKQNVFAFLMAALLLFLAFAACDSAASEKNANDSIILREFEWPRSEIANLLPVPKSNIGSISWEASYGFVIYIGETSKEQYDSYVDECWERGFNLDYRKGDDFFWANNNDGYKATVRYEDNNVMFIRIDEPEKNQSSATMEPTIETTVEETTRSTTEKPANPPTQEPTTMPPTTEKPTQPPTTAKPTDPATTAPPPTTEAKLNGIHTVSYDNGDRYTGNFVDGIRSGQGTYTWANGTVYTGEFVNGSPSGNGNYVYPTTEPPPTQKPTDPPAPSPNPPPSQSKPSSGIVYWVKSGQVYHSTPNCPSLSRSRDIYSGTIAQSGKDRPCERCH